MHIQQDFFRWMQQPTDDLTADPAGDAAITATPYQGPGFADEGGRNG